MFFLFFSFFNISIIYKDELPQTKNKFKFSLNGNRFWWYQWRRKSGGNLENGKAPFKKARELVLYLWIYLKRLIHLTYSFTDNFLSSIPVSEWLIFCCGNFLLHQQKNENDKKTSSLDENQPKSVCQKNDKKYMQTWSSKTSKL